MPSAKRHRTGTADIVRCLFGHAKPTGTLRYGKMPTRADNNKPPAAAGGFSVPGKALHADDVAHALFTGLPCIQCLIVPISGSFRSSAGG